MKPAIMASCCGPSTRGVRASEGSAIASSQLQVEAG